MIGTQKGHHVLNQTNKKSKTHLDQCFLYNFCCRVCALLSKHYVIRLSESQVENIFDVRPKHLVSHVST